MGAETRFESLVCGESGQLLRSPWASLSGKLELPSLPYWRDIISNDGKRESVRIYAGIGNFGARAGLSSYCAQSAESHADFGEFESRIDLGGCMPPVKPGRQASIAASFRERNGFAGAYRSLT